MKKNYLLVGGLVSLFLILLVGCENGLDSSNPGDGDSLQRTATSAGVYSVNGNLVSGSSIVLKSQTYEIRVRVNTDNGTTMYSPQAWWNNNLVSVSGPYAVGSSTTQREFRSTVSNYYNGSYQGAGYYSFAVDNVSAGVNIIQQ